MKTHYSPDEEMFYATEITVARRTGPTRLNVFIPKKYHDKHPAKAEEIARNIEKAKATHGPVLPQDAVTCLLWHEPWFIRKAD